MKASQNPLFRTVVSRRSRRLRTTGLVLLAVIIGMAVYGNLRLMPSVRHAVAHLQAAEAELQTAHNFSNAAAVKQMQVLGNAKKVMLSVVVFTYTYWTICGLLIISLLIVAWLDLREVARNYSQQRQHLWLDAVERTRQDADAKQRRG